MSRRSSLPGADELFRTTGPERSAGTRSAAERPDDGDGPDTGLAAVEAALSTLPVGGSTSGPSAAVADAAPSVVSTAGLGGNDDLVDSRQPAGSVRHTGIRRRPRAVGDRRPSGRERHDEKITVYVSAEELMDLEHARLALRGEHGLVADRGRIVREALAVVLADLEAKGDASILVRRLTGR
ncbi:MAG: hypothetical protein Q8R60_10060 [Mycobacteriales bacterium]|nr:hypothetical protein [Mycobacteriales bacterium]